MSSKLRTVELPTSNYVLSPVVRYPTKDAIEVLDYSLDCTRWLRDARDTMLSFAVDCTPNGNALDLQVISQSPVGPVLTAMIGGGVLGRDYAVRFVGETVGGLSFDYTIKLLVRQVSVVASPVTPVPSPNPTPDPTPTPSPAPVPSGPANFLIFPMAVASDSWVIQHGLGRTPSVVVTDTSGNEVEGTVHYDTLNQVSLTFSFPFAGTAYLT